MTFRHIQSQGAAVDFAAVEIANGRERRFAVAELDEAVAFGFSSFFILYMYI